MDQWSKTTSHQKRDSNTLQYGELRSYCGSRLVKVRPLDLHQLQRQPLRQERHSSSSSSTSSSSPTVNEIQTREREDGIDSDISPVQVSTSVDDRSGQPDKTQANNLPKTNKKETTIELGNPLCSEIPEWHARIQGKFGG